jgi:hypothetical protein
MRKFNWKLALKKRWLEFSVAVVWFISAIVNLSRYCHSGAETALITAICGATCVPCWLFIFYKRAREDGA